MTLKGFKTEGFLLVEQTLYYMCGMITINFHSKVYLRTDTAATRRDTSAFYAVITLIQNKGKPGPLTFNTLFKLARLLIYCTRYYVKTVFPKSIYSRDVSPLHCILIF